jgi:catalase
MFIPLNTAAYSPNTLNGGFPQQANQTQGRGFFTAPNRSVTGKLVRSVSSTFTDVWSQPRLFFNSLTKPEQQFLVNAILFETSHLTSSVVKQNVLIQLNRVSHEVAVRVASTLGMQAPAPDPTFYHNNKTQGVSPFSDKLPKLDGLVVGYLTSLNSTNGLNALGTLKSALTSAKVDLIVVAERLGPGIDQTYSAADATGFDAIIADGGAGEALFSKFTQSTDFPSGRPSQIVLDGFRWGKPVGSIGASNGTSVINTIGIPQGPGVFTSSKADTTFANSILDGLRMFKFFDRFPLDNLTS